MFLFIKVTAKPMAYTCIKICSYLQYTIDSSRQHMLSIKWNQNCQNSLPSSHTCQELRNWNQPKKLQYVLLKEIKKIASQLFVVFYGPCYCVCFCVVVLCQCSGLYTSSLCFLLMQFQTAVEVALAQRWTQAFILNLSNTRRPPVLSFSPCSPWAIR